MRTARPASLVLYDVSTLYFETDTGDGFREPGFYKERRLEPQITIGHQPLDRAPDRLVHPQVRQDCPALPHH